MLFIILKAHQGAIWCLNSVEWRLVFEAALLGCKVLQGFLSLAWSSERTGLTILVEHCAEKCVFIISTGSSGRGRPISHEFTVVVGSAFFLSRILIRVVLINIVIKAKINEFLHGCVISFLDLRTILTAAVFWIGLSSDQCRVLDIKSLIRKRCLSRVYRIIFIFIGSVSIIPLNQIFYIYVVHICSLIGILHNSLSNG